MKLLTIRPPRARSGHFGALLSNGSVLDLTTVSAGAALPRSMMACVRGGAPAQDATRNAIQDAETRIRGGQQVAGVYRQDQVTFLPPITPGKIMAIGRNYAAHVAEAGNAAAPTRPGGFIKLVNCLTGHNQTVFRPPWDEKLDYENELAVVMGVDCLDISAERCYDYVFGYTIMNDVSARTIQLAEAKEGNITVGKNFPTSAPLGPWIVTKDEIPDPHNLQLTTRVNGEVRQDANTVDQIHKIPAQLNSYSRAGFQAGDIVSTGTPAGVALGYNGPGSWYMKHGDVVECEIGGIGVLRNPIKDRRE